MRPSWIYTFFVQGFGEMKEEKATGEGEGISRNEYHHHVTFLRSIEVDKMHNINMNIVIKEYVRSFALCEHQFCCAVFSLPALKYTAASERAATKRLCFHIATEHK